MKRECQRKKNSWAINLRIGRLNLKGQTVCDTTGVGSSPIMQIQLLPPHCWSRQPIKSIDVNAKPVGYCSLDSQGTSGILHFVFESVVKEGLCVRVCVFCSDSKYDSDSVLLNSDESSLSPLLPGWEQQCLHFVFTLCKQQLPEFQGIKWHRKSFWCVFTFVTVCTVSVSIWRARYLVELIKTLHFCTHASVT